ncbi:MAG: hypothetical protein ACRYFS_15015, partial [Janthinobacterium lividum]
HKIHQLGAAELAALREADDDDTTKILNLRKALAEAVDRDSGSKPFVVGIGERAESLLQAFEDRQQSTQQVLAAFEKLAEEYVSADAERLSLGVDANTFAIYRTLKPLVSSVTAAQSQALNVIFTQHPDAAWDEEQERRLRTALYAAVLPWAGAKKMVMVTNALMNLERV